MKNFINNLIKRELYIYYFSIPSLIVGWLGLKRTYYSSPDQDFIWIIQSIRFLKGVGPSYNDHPGAYWPLSFLIKFYFLSRNLVFDFIDQYGAVSEEIIKKIISISRVENCLISASLPLLFFIDYKRLQITIKRVNFFALLHVVKYFIIRWAQHHMEIHLILAH